jgi:hypothetical protein
MRSVILAACLLLAAVHGGRAAADEAKGGKFSCDYPEKKPRVCVDVAWSGGDHSEAAGRASCAEKKGVSVPSCSHADAVGGCKVGMSANGMSMSTTNWQYGGDRGQFEAMCSAMGGTLVK